MIGDEDYERSKAYLLKKIKEQTKAVVVDPIEEFLAKNPPPQLTDVQVYEREKPNGVLCRWKFAFRDLSKTARVTNAPTMIRTRSGK